ncbi:enoyl-CoA hydratase/isomerase family protein [Chloroflexota bacterium]
MPYRTIAYRETGGIGTITLNRPRVNNALNTQSAQEMGDVCAKINQDQAVRVVIITGAGKSFSVGTDLNDVSSEAAWWSVAGPVSRLNCPVIAAINGDALGQSLELALACDLRIAAETARLGLLQITSGFIPRDGGTQRLPRLIGRAQALEMILLGEPVDANEAYRMGLVNKVVPPEELLPVVSDTARRMASMSPLALRYIKEAVSKGLELTMGQGLRLETDLSLILQTTEDRTEGITAFREKRLPEFKGK